MAKSDASWRTALAGTAAVTARANPPGTKSQLNWSLLWLWIARERLRVACEARESDDISTEFRASLLAIVSAAFAVEAEHKLVFKEEPQPATEPPARRWKRNFGDRLGQVLVETVSIDQSLAKDLGRLFHLRNKSVHPLAKHESFVLHPAGGKVPRVVAAYNADVAAEQLRVSELVVAALSALSSRIS